MRLEMLVDGGHCTSRYEKVMWTRRSCWSRLAQTWRLRMMMDSSHCTSRQMGGTWRWYERWWMLS
jgi:ankyrin repeat protein